MPRPVTLPAAIGHFTHCRNPDVKSRPVFLRRFGFFREPPGLGQHSPPAPHPHGAAVAGAGVSSPHGSRVIGLGSVTVTSGPTNAVDVVRAPRAPGPFEPTEPAGLRGVSADHALATPASKPRSTPP